MPLVGFRNLCGSGGEPGEAGQEGSSGEDPGEGNGVAGGSSSEGHHEFCSPFSSKGASQDAWVRSMTSKALGSLASNLDGGILARSLDGGFLAESLRDALEPIEPSL